MKPQPKYLTTEQWVEAAIKAIEKWSPEQKARARKILIRQVGGPHRIGESGEPSYTTPAGFPICSECGRSTRNRNRLICRPCESRTRLLLTDEDRRWLREIGIAR